MRLNPSLTLHPFLACLLLCASIASGASPQVASGPKNGFRDLVWGSGPTSDMVVLGETQNGTTYTRPSDKLAIGDVPVTAIQYMFLKGRLAVVVVAFQFDVLGELETFLENVWGPSLAQPMQDTFWKSASTTVVEKCELIGTRMENCRLQFASNAALNKVAADDDARKKREAQEKQQSLQKKAASDL